MSKILTSYAVNVDPLPPEGSEEWLAMLPGWQGWVFEGYSYFWIDRHDSAYIMLAIDYYGDRWYSSSIPCRSSIIIDIPRATVKYLASGMPYIEFDSSTCNRCYGSCYIFRGPKNSGNSSSSQDVYAIGWATSLTPQR